MLDIILGLVALVLFLLIFPFPFTVLFRILGNSWWGMLLVVAGTFLAVCFITDVWWLALIFGVMILLKFNPVRERTYELSVTDAFSEWREADLLEDYLHVAGTLMLTTIILAFVNYAMVRDFVKAFFLDYTEIFGL